MTEAFRSAVAYRHDLCETVAQLQQRLTRPLPNGATVYVASTGALYLLKKDAGDTFDDLASIVLIPSDGSENRWFKQSVNGASPLAGTEIAAAAVNVTPAGLAQWTALGSTAGSFALSSGDEDLFQVDAASSLLVYHGPEQMMRVAYQVSLGNNGAPGVIVVQTALSVDGDVVSGTTTEHRGSGEQTATALDTVIVNMSGERMATLTDESTVRLMLRNMGDTKVMRVYFCSISLTPV